MDFVFQNGDKEIRLSEFLNFLNKQSAEYFAKSLPNLKPNTYKGQIGSKNIKIVTYNYGDESGGGSVYCFLAKNGDIYKAASWKAPAKHKRGSIFDENFSWGRGLSQYGAAYMR